MEDLCILIASQRVQDLNMPSPDRNSTDLFDHELKCEQSYDVEALIAYVQTHEPKLLPEQKSIYDTIIRAIIGSIESHTEQFKKQW